MSPAVSGQSRRQLQMDSDWRFSLGDPAGAEKTGFDDSNWRKLDDDRNAWLALRDNAPYAGQFLWSGIDYLGEARAWPGIGFPFGLLDRTGTARPRAFERQSWWSDEPMVHMTRCVAPTPLAPTDPGYEPDPRRIQVLFSDWTPRNLDAHDETVEVYSNCESVELFLNGKSLGAKPLPPDASPRTWMVRFESGTLLAVAKNRGRIVARDELKTAASPARIVVTADRTRVAPVWDDVVHVTAKIVAAAQLGEWRNQGATQSC